MSSRNKIHNKALRRGGSRATGNPIPVEPVNPAVVFALKLQAVPMVKLIRGLKKSLRRAATAKYLLAALHAGSKFGPPLSAEQTHQLCLAKQVFAEIKSRNHQT